MHRIFIALDGDNVGSNLEFLVIKNDIESLRDFSRKFEESIRWFEGELKRRFHAVTIFSGGDNLLVYAEQEKFSIAELRDLKEQFYLKCQKTLSIGLGKTPREAYFSLKFAKSSGKNTIINFEDINDE